MVNANKLWVKQFVLTSSRSNLWSSSQKIAYLRKLGFLKATTYLISLLKLSGKYKESPENFSVRRLFLCREFSAAPDLNTIVSAGSSVPSLSWRQPYDSVNADRAVVLVQIAAGHWVCRLKCKPTRWDHPQLHRKALHLPGRWGKYRRSLSRLTLFDHNCITERHDRRSLPRALHHDFPDTATNSSILLRRHSVALCSV